MLERSAIVVGLIVAVLVASLAIRTLTRRRAAAAEGRELPGELRVRFPDHGPGIVYFYGPRCGSCRQQAAILDSLSNDDGVAVVRVDAASETALADALAVMTIPATVVVDSARVVRAVNLGLRSRDELTAQLRDLAGFPTAVA